MKSTIIFFCLLVPSFVFSQESYPCPDDHTPTHENITSSIIFSSSTASTVNQATNAIDGDINTVAKTRYENNPYIQVNYNEDYAIPYLIINSPSIPPNFYIFLTTIPILPSDDLDALLANSFITANQIFNYTSGDTLRIVGFGRYLRIQFDQLSELEISEMRIPGDPLAEEICDNGIDDNCDNLIDCSDYQCGVKIFNVTTTTTSCPICNDGAIRIKTSYGENLEFSIDGGLTWSSLCWNEYHHSCIWLDLPVGQYQVQARNSESGCMDVWSEIVEITSPPPGVDGPCENGAFETGTFLNWTGADGDHDNPGIITYTTNTIQQNIKQFIRRSQFFSLPEFGLVGNNYQALGSYFAQLGNTIIGGDAAMLEYCFTVDNSNTNFNFLYFVVLSYSQLHDPAIQSFFEWTLYIDDGQPINPSNTIDYVRVVADTQNDFFDIIEEELRTIVYKPWTCQSYDLTQYVGQNLCIQFVASDCLEEGHFGYAFIDGLCLPIEELAPNIDIETTPLMCVGQNVEINVIGSGYNQYTWNISQINDQGIECCTATTNTIGYNASIQNLIGYYEANSTYNFECGRLKLELIAYNDCGESSDEIIVSVNCRDDNINYCDIIPICDTYSNQQILGTNDCLDCVYTWTPAQFLSFGNDEAFPFINLVQFPYAAEETYHVTVVSPAGCIYEEEIEIYDFSQIEMDFTKEVNHCSYKLIITVDTRVDVPNDAVSLILEESIANESIEIDLNEELSSGHIKVFSTTILRDKNTFLYAIFELDLGYFGNCASDLLCTETLTIGPEPKSNYLGPWRIWFPTAFSPNGDGENDVWNPFLSGNSLDCNAHSLIYNNVYGMKVTIRDRWGDVHYEKELFRGIYDSEGILDSDFIWDGTGIGGLPVQSGVYVAQVELWSCYGTAGYDDCYIYCPCMPGGQYACTPFCNNSNHEIFFTDITVTL